jgi:hypothetical protein
MNLIKLIFIGNKKKVVNRLTTYEECDKLLQFKIVYPIQDESMNIFSMTKTTFH